jgi:hypothetical protein
MQMLIMLKKVKQGCLRDARAGLDEIVVNFKGARILTDKLN